MPKPLQHTSSNVLQELHNVAAAACLGWYQSEVLWTPRLDRRIKPNSDQRTLPDNVWKCGNICNLGWKAQSEARSWSRRVARNVLGACCTVGMWHVSFSAAKSLIQAVVGEICVKTCSEVIIILVRYGELMSALFDFCYWSILTFFLTTLRTFPPKQVNSFLHSRFQTDQMLLKGQVFFFVLFFTKYMQCIVYSFEQNKTK